MFWHTDKSLCNWKKYSKLLKMAWASKSGRIFKMAASVAVGASAALYLTGEKKSNEGNSGTLPLNKVLASWTTNFTPSKEWDHNWDRWVFISH